MDLHTLEDHHIQNPHLIQSPQAEFPAKQLVKSQPELVQFTLVENWRVESEKESVEECLVVAMKNLKDIEVVVDIMVSIKSLRAYKFCAIIIFDIGNGGMYNQGGGMYGQGVYMSEENRQEMEEIREEPEEEREGPFNIWGILG